MKRTLNGKIVEHIDSRLQPREERPDPHRLKGNGGLCYQGSIVVGMGFTFDDTDRKGVASSLAEMARLKADDRRNTERISPYIGGHEINTSPTQDSHRYVIDFGDLSEEEARRWPDLMAIVEEKVKPGRMKVNRASHRQYWWHYGEKRPALYTAIADLPRCLATCRHTTHLIFSFQPPNRVFAESLIVFPLQTYAHFALLQSRVHELWARLLSSSLGMALRYVPSDCFDTFPFPESLDALEEPGRVFYEARAAYMVETQQGLTQTYNLITDPSCTDLGVQHLRDLDRMMNEAVLAVYGWEDLTLDDPGFAAQVIDRLYDLNMERHLT